MKRIKNGEGLDLWESGANKISEFFFLWAKYLDYKEHNGYSTLTIQEQSLQSMKANQMIFTPIR
jgi:hypothetical protein